MLRFIQQQALNAMRVAHAVHNMYRTESKKPLPLFSNSYQRHYVDGFSPRMQTRPGVLIAESYYDIPISTIYTPVGELKVTGSGCQGPNGHDMELEILNQDPNFDMVLVKAGFQNELGYFGPWYQITRVGTDIYPQIATFDDAWQPMESAMCPNECRKVHNMIYRAAFEMGVHDDVMGLTARLLAGERPDPCELFKELSDNCRNPHIRTCDLQTKVQQLYTDNVVNWTAWLSIVYSTHLNK